LPTFRDKRRADSAPQPERRALRSAFSDEEGGFRALLARLAETHTLLTYDVLANWPLSHSLYFLAMSAARASALDHRWPLLQRKDS
jgi:hypothetical protein